MYVQYYGGAFKIAAFDQWMVMVAGPEMVEDLRRRPDDEFSFVEAADEVRPHVRAVLGLCFSRCHTILFCAV